MDDDPIGADSALCNSNVVDIRHAQRKRTMRSGRRPDFDMAMAIAEQTKAHYEYLSASNKIQHMLGAPIEAGYPEMDNIFRRYRAQVFALAQIPVRDKFEMRRKRSAIGTIWLRAKGEWYDRLREFVARDG